MSKFLLTDWEINGYDDSDFMASYYDDMENKIGFICYGSTRYPSATVIGINSDGITSVSVGDDVLKMPSAELVEKARLVLADTIFQTLKASDKRLVEEPDVKHLHAGLRVRLIEKSRMQLREYSTCNKCNGSGKWVNPRNADDKRDCFACKGSGRHVGAKVKSEEGKQVYKELPAGLSGEVIEWGSFGQFYSNGYNQPDRHNTSVQFRIDGGEIVRASLSKLRLDRECRTDEELTAKANELSYHYQFSSLYPKHAWDTRNYAAEIATAEIATAELVKKASA